jgi:hypothetical protein
MRFSQNRIFLEKSTFRGGPLKASTKSEAAVTTTVQKI